MEHLQQGRMRELGSVCEHGGPAAGTGHSLWAWRKGGPQADHSSLSSALSQPGPFPGAGAPRTAACEAVLASSGVGSVPRAVLVLAMPPAPGGAGEWLWVRGGARLEEGEPWLAWGPGGGDSVSVTRCERGAGPRGRLESGGSRARPSRRPLACDPRGSGGQADGRAPSPGRGC